jgi:predicted transcriptional regulator
MIEQFKEFETRDSGIMYNSTLDQIKMLYAMDPVKAGELAISAIELLLCGDISSDDPMIKVMLMPTKAIRDKDKKKHDQKVENTKNKRISDLKLDIIAELHRKGLRQRQIAERLGLTQQTVSNRLGVIRTEFPHLLQDEELVEQENVCKNTSDLFVQTCTNDTQLVQTVQDSTSENACTNGEACKNDKKNPPKLTASGRIAELGF